MKKRFVSIILSLVLVAAVIPLNAYAHDGESSTWGSSTSRGYSTGGTLGQAYIECFITGMDGANRDSVVAVMESTGVGRLSVQPIIIYTRNDGVEVTLTGTPTVKTGTDCSASLMADNANATLCKGNFSYSSTEYGTYTPNTLRAPIG